MNAPKILRSKTISLTCKSRKPSTGTLRVTKSTLPRGLQSARDRSELSNLQGSGSNQRLLSPVKAQPGRVDPQVGTPRTKKTGQNIHSRRVKGENHLTAVKSQKNINRLKFGFNTLKPAKVLRKNEGSE